jgi:drug/metabolite transporter (DMT)-like permease
MESSDFAALVHSAIAVAFVFPLIGMVVNFAWQARQRRRQTVEGGKSKIPPIVGPEHMKYGRWLAGSVVGLSLIGLGHPTFEYVKRENLWSTASSQVSILVLFFMATIASLIFLFRARQTLWINVFAALTAIGVLIIGFQDLVFKREGFGAIFRRDNEWYWSHFYFGIAATLLMIFSLAIIQHIYQDRSHRWRNLHVILNCIALLLFIGQGMTGTRDLLEIPLGWQKQYIYQCNFDPNSPDYKTCPWGNPPTPQSQVPTSAPTL